MTFFTENLFLILPASGNAFFDEFLMFYFEHSFSKIIKKQKHPKSYPISKSTNKKLLGKDNQASAKLSKLSVPPARGLGDFFTACTLV